MTQIDAARLAMEADGGGAIEVRTGAVAESLVGSSAGGPAFDVTDQRFLLRAPNGLRILVEGGTTITVDRPAHLSDDDVLLWLLGSGWGALAYQRGHLPLHMSAITLGNGRVCGFGGPSGAGKSTLAAALAQHGHPIFADDVTAIIRPSSGDASRHDLIALPGHRTLKLWGDAAERLGLVVDRPIRTDEPLDKFYVADEVSTPPTPAPLDRLYVLGDRPALPTTDPDIIIERRTGMDAVAALHSSIYRPMFGEAILGRRAIFVMLAALAANTDVYAFERPHRTDTFRAGVDILMAHLDDSADASRSETAAIRRAVPTARPTPDGPACLT